MHDFDDFFPLGFDDDYEEKNHAVKIQIPEYVYSDLQRICRGLGMPVATFVASTVTRTVSKIITGNLVESTPVHVPMPPQSAVKQIAREVVTQPVQKPKSKKKNKGKEKGGSKLSWKNKPQKPTDFE